ncbi:UDP-N-acetylmuramoyl-tripeptide--D-alanyl-D-alanine ligase [Patescibacteria group bacterium]|nr:UDP-N-acetylmuramoyl-tripeptide--D-alanyl-D-alanine ligase [Patescibacteria group bacterium]
MIKKIFHRTRRIIAKVWLKLNPQITVIGVTGSYGKTNTVRAISQVLSEKFKTLQTDLNLDTNYNLPITLLKIRPWQQKVVLEYGVDHLGEMDFHLGLVKPQIAILTGINPTHADEEHLGSVENIIKEKKKLLLALSRNGLAVLNWDDKLVRPMAQGFQAKVVFYGSDKKKCDFWAERIKVGFKGTTFLLGYRDGKVKKTLQVKTPLIGRHFVQDCLATVAIGFYQGLNTKQIKNGLLKLKPLAGRLSVEKGPLGSVLLNDSLRANPASTLAGLQTLADLSTKGQRVAVLGEMGELDQSAEVEHQRIGQKVAELKIDFFIGVGTLQKLATQQALASGLKKEQVFWAKDVLEAARILKKILRKGDLFYLKGSRLRHMERILLVLQGEEAACRVADCHFYHHCESCPYLRTGL